MSDSTQKALVIPYHKGPFTLATRPITKPGPGDILVRIESIGLNPAEWKFQRGVVDIEMLVKMGVVKGYPMLVGTDGAGTVVEVGADVSQIHKGDRVLFQGWFESDRSTYQEYTLVYADLAAKLPPAIGTLEASSIPLALATAAMGFAAPFSSEGRGGAGLKGFWENDAKNYYSGRPILILGGASAVGQYAIQIATYMGFSPIVTTCSLKHTEFLKSIGATHIIDRKVDREALGDEFKRISTIPLDIVYDAVHHPITQAEVGLLVPGGTIITVWETDEALLLKDERKAVFAGGSVHINKEQGRKMYARLSHFLESGILKPTRVQKLEGGLSGILKGLDMLEKDQVSGVKLVVDPRDKPNM